MGWPERFAIVSALIVWTLAAEGVAQEGGPGPASDTSAAVANYVDFTDEFRVLPLALYVDPLGASGVVVGSSNGVEGGGTVRLRALRFGSTAWRMFVGDAQFFLLSSSSVDVDFRAEVDVIGRGMQYLLCRDGDGDVSLSYPFVELLDAGNGDCALDEALYYSFAAGQMRFRESRDAIAVRLVEFAIGVNAFGTGRTSRVLSEALMFEAGVSWDYVDFHEITRPAGTGDTDFAARGLVAAELTLTTPDPLLRFSASARWRLRFGLWEDQQVIGRMSISLFIAASADLLFALSTAGAVAYNSWPWTSTEVWTDLESEWSVLGQLSLDLYWGST